MGVKIALLLLETQSKVKLMKLEDASRSPEEIIGPFSMSVLFWLNNLMMRGVRKLLLLEDLFPLDSSLAARHVHSIFWKKWESLSPSKGKSRLLWALWQTLKWAILTPIFPRLALIGFTFCQPFLINRIISYLQYSADHASKRVGYGLIGATAIVYVGIAISSVLYGYQNQRTITKLRACLVSAIFRQTTNLKSTSNDSNSVTLMSSDIERIQIGASVFHDLWANAIQVGLAAGLLRRELGTAFLVSLGTVLICGIASFLLGKLSGGRQALWMTALERRVSAITHIISNMKSLKMSGLSMHMNNHIQELREKELQAMSRARMLTTFSTVIGFTPLLITPVLTFAASSKNLDIGKIFTSLSFILLLTDPLTHLFQDIPLIIAAITCLDRVVAFLNSEPYRDGRHFGDLNDDTPLEIPKDSGKNSRQGTSSEDIEMLPMRHLEPEIHSPLVRIRNGYFGWEDGNKLVLRDINLDIPSSQLTMVVGPIGCGKTTLCKALLGEVPLMEGQTVFQERLTGVGFCDQTPYLPSKSIREIIIGDSEFDNSWYNEVIEVTALKPDLDTFPDGVSTIVGTRGTKLSGGQRQRLTIARALYARPSFAIFDDVLSGLDPSTLEHVFQKVFGPRGILQRQKATIVLCTHAIKYLGMADNVIQLGADGSIIHAGKFTDQGLSNQYFQSLQAQHLEKTLGSANIEEEIQTGFAGKSGAGIEKLDQGRQMGDVSIYRYYFSTIGIRALIPFFLFGISFGFTHNFSTVWLKFWSDENTRHPQSKSRYGYFLGIYSMIQLLDLLILGLYCQQNGSSLALKAGTRLHMKALRTLINAPMSYFSSTDIGITTNRFSQDMSIIDSQLAFGLSNTVLTGTTVIGQAAVLAIASPYIAVGYPLLLAILYGIQKFYLRTSRQLRFMDLETKSPL
jgi:ABC-type multidrug transport system fused ATPase/permease subunit